MSGNARRNHRRCSVRRGVLRNFAKFVRDVLHSVWFLIKSVCSKIVERGRLSCHEGEFLLILDIWMYIKFGIHRYIIWQYLETLIFHPMGAPSPRTYIAPWDYAPYCLDCLPYFSWLPWREEHFCQLSCFFHNFHHSCNTLCWCPVLMIW